MSINPKELAPEPCISIYLDEFVQLLGEKSVSISSIQKVVSETCTGHYGNGMLLLFYKMVVVQL